MMARTSDRVSSIAARLIHIDGDEIASCAVRGNSHLENLVQDIRAMAASLLAQDEYRGIRGRIRKVFGR